MADAIIHYPGNMPNTIASWNALFKVANDVKDDIVIKTIGTINLMANQASGTVLYTFTYKNDTGTIVDINSLNMTMSFGGSGGLQGAWYANNNAIMSNKVFWTSDWDITFTTPVELRTGESVTFTLKRTNTSSSSGTCTNVVVTFKGIINK